MSNRDLFAELNSALVEAKEHSEGQIIRKIHQADDAAEPTTLANKVVKTQDKGSKKIRSS